MTRRPLAGSLAMRLQHLRQAGKADEAAALLDAHNRCRAFGGQPPYDEADDWTDVPLEGLVTCSAVPYTRIVRDIDPRSGRERVAA